MKTFPLVLVVCIGAALCGRVCPLHAGQPPQKIAILPLTGGGPENIDYVAEGLRDMIAARVASSSGLAVIEQAAVKDQYPGAGKEIPSLEKVRGVGKALGAEYVLFGSVAAMGSDLIIAVNMLDVSGDTAPIPVFSQTLGPDEVIPRLQLIAREVKNAADDALRGSKEDMTSRETPAKPKGAVEETKGVRAASAGAVNSEPAREMDDAIMRNETAEASGNARMGQSEPSEEDSEAAGDEAERQERIRELLFKRKGDITAPPENPVYEKSVDELQHAADPQPQAE